MTEERVNEVASRFRWQMRAAAVVRLGVALSLLAGLLASSQVGPAQQRWILAGMAALVGAWVILGLRGVVLLKRARHSAAQLSAGRLDEARENLLDVLGRFTLLRSVKILAGHQLAVAAHLGRRYREAIVICSELLRHRLGGTRSVATDLRLILADSLLMLDEIGAVGPVMQAIDDEHLSLADRLTLLPIELRYQLTAGREAEAVRSLPTRVRLAELLDPSSAAQAHALLAEACRRANLTPQQDYLLQRAALLADLEPIVARFPRILGDLGIEAVTTAEIETREP